MKGQLNQMTASSGQTEALIRHAEAQVAALQDAAGVAGLSVVEATKSANAAAASAAALEKQIVLEQRPRLEVSAFYFREIQSQYRTLRGIQDGSVAAGQFTIRNAGGTQASIQEIWCKAMLLPQTLPMRRPYEGEYGEAQNIKLAPGQSVPFTFALDESSRLNAGAARSVMNDLLVFYVMGWLGYTDDLGIYRIVNFCRQYDRSLDRLVPVKDPDYERED